MNVKRLLPIILILPILLAGCLSPISVRIVADVYEAAIVEDEELVANYFSEEYLAENPVEELTEEMAEDARHRYGVHAMNIKELRNREMQDSYIEKMENKYDEDWQAVVAQTDDREVVVWTVIRGETMYYIVDSQRMNFDTYNNDILS